MLRDCYGFIRTDFNFYVLIEFLLSMSLLFFGEITKYSIHFFLWCYLAIYNKGDSREYVTCPLIY